MKWLLFFLIPQFNLVMVKENRVEVEKWANLSISSHELYIQLPDTIERYKVLDVSSYRGSEIVRLSGEGYSGICKIEERIVYFYCYNSNLHTSTERLFIRDSKRWTQLRNNGTRKNRKVLPRKSRGEEEKGGNR